MEKRVFLIVLDSCGCGEMPDSADFGDAGSNTLRACTTSSKLNIPMLTKMGIFNIDEVGCGTPVAAPVGAYGRMAEKSRGKDTPSDTGSWQELFRPSRCRPSPMVSRRALSRPLRKRPGVRCCAISPIPGHHRGRSASAGAK